MIRLIRRAYPHSASLRSCPLPFAIAAALLAAAPAAAQLPPPVAPAVADDDLIVEVESQDAPADEPLAGPVPGFPPELAPAPNATPPRADRGPGRPAAVPAATSDPAPDAPASPARPETPAAPPLAATSPAPDSDLIRLHLMDGAVIAGRLSMKEITVETQFGNLSVPVTSIRSITPGLGSHPELAKQVSKLIVDLGSSNYNEREKAQQALLKLGLMVRAELEKAQSDTDVERRNRAKAILAEFDQLQEEGDSSDHAATILAQRDTVETTEFTIVGKIVPQSFSISSPYGDLNIKLADIRRGQRDTAKKEDIRQTFSVDGTHMAFRNTLNTNIRVERGDVVTIVADGTLTMTPWGNGSISTPEGGQNFGWFIPGQIPSGALVGRIGNEQFVKYGSKHTFTADKNGALQLGIGMQADYAENQFPGKYTVKVRVQKKQS